MKYRITVCLLLVVLLACSLPFDVSRTTSPPIAEQADDAGYTTITAPT